MLRMFETRARVFIKLVNIIVNKFPDNFLFQVSGDNI